MVAAYCFVLRELSISDCSQVGDPALLELARLGPKLRYLSAAKCSRVTDIGISAIAKERQDIALKTWSYIRSDRDINFEMGKKTFSHCLTVTTALLQAALPEPAGLRGCQRQGRGVAGALLLPPALARSRQVRRDGRRAARSRCAPARPPQGAASNIECSHSENKVDIGF